MITTTQSVCSGEALTGMPKRVANARKRADSYDWVHFLTGLCVGIDLRLQNHHKARDCFVVVVRATDVCTLLCGELFQSALNDHS